MMAKHSKGQPGRKPDVGQQEQALRDLIRDLEGAQRLQEMQFQLIRQALQSVKKLGRT